MDDLRYVLRGDMKLSHGHVHKDWKLSSLKAKHTFMLLLYMLLYMLFVHVVFVSC